MALDNLCFYKVVFSKRDKIETRLPALVSRLIYEGFSANGKANTS